MKEWRCWLPLVFQRCLCFVIAFSIILLNTSIGVDASSGVKKGEVTTKTLTWNVSDAISGLDDFNTTRPLDYGRDWEEDWEFKSNDTSFYETVDKAYVHGYVLSSPKLLFNGSTDAEYYRIKSVPSDDFTLTLGGQIVSVRLIYGTMSQLYGDGGVISSKPTAGASYTATVRTEYDTSAIYAAFLLTVADTFIYKDIDYKIKGSIDFTITEYNMIDDGVSGSLDELNDTADHQLDEMKDTNTKLDNLNSAVGEQHKTQKSMLKGMTDFFGSFFDNLVESVLGIFVPSTSQMGELLEQFTDFFNERFGFLFFPFDFFIDLIDVFLNSENNNTTLVFPGFSLMGYQVWEDIEFDLTQYEVVVDVFGYVRLVTGSVLSLAFIDYLRKFFDRRFGGGGS